jgi:hypothetical protein
MVVGQSKTDNHPCSMFVTAVLQTIRDHPLRHTSTTLSYSIPENNPQEPDLYFSSDAIEPPIPESLPKFVSES